MFARNAGHSPGGYRVFTQTRKNSLTPSKGALVTGRARDAHVGDDRR